MFLFFLVLLTFALGTAVRAWPTLISMWPLDFVCPNRRDFGVGEASCKLWLAAIWQDQRNWKLPCGNMAMGNPWKSPINGSSNEKISHQWMTSNCHVWLLEGKLGGIQTGWWFQPIPKPLKTVATLFSDTKAFETIQIKINHPHVLDLFRLIALHLSFLVTPNPF